jgi:sugar lactone lactonase YvrE
MTSVVEGTLQVWRTGSAILVESLWWDSALGAMRWTDISAGTLHTGALDAAVDGTEDTAVRLPPPLASFQPSTGGGFIAALGDRVVLAAEDGSIERELATIRHRHAEIRLNEGKCDPFGNFVVGSMDLRDESPDGAIYRVRPNGSTEILLGGVAVANGFEWSDDGRTFYFSDTAVSTVYRADYDPDGSLSDARPLLTGLPSDGLARDSDGGFWSGLYGGGAVVRRTADGVVTDRIELPAPNITSVAFGGPDLSTLFVGSAREKLTEQELERHPGSGAIFAVPTSVRGFAVHPYRPSATTP